MKEVILLGRINLKKPPIGGETAKNQNLLNELGQYCKVFPLDFYNNKRRLWIFPYSLFILLFHRKATLILSTDAGNIYKLFKVRQYLKSKRNLVHWVIGGAFDKKVRNGVFSVEVLNTASYHLVEGKAMKENLDSMGVRNVMNVVNFRQVKYLPSIDVGKYTSPISIVKFVYFGRIVRSKGIDYLLDAIAKLNQMGYTNRFVVDFYGIISNDYSCSFSETVNALPNVAYKGFLDFKTKSGYDEIAQYHVMVFPTCNPGEGVAGVLIDAYAAGLPIIATKWGCNDEVVIDGKTGLVIPPKNSSALADAMKSVVEGCIPLAEMSFAARNEIDKYRIENCITPDFLRAIKVL